MTSLLSKTVSNLKMRPKTLPSQLNCPNYAENRMFISFSVQKKIGNKANFGIKKPNSINIYTRDSPNRCNLVSTFQFLASLASWYVEDPQLICRRPPLSTHKTCKKLEANLCRVPEPPTWPEGHLPTLWHYLWRTSYAWILCNSRGPRRWPAQNVKSRGDVLMR